MVFGEINNGYIVIIGHHCMLLHVVDAADVSEASMINQFVICDHCKLLIPAADNLGEHVCESAAAADVIKTEADLVVESSVSRYRCDYCHKTFSQVTCCIITTNFVLLLVLCN